VDGAQPADGPVTAGTARLAWSLLTLALVLAVTGATLWVANGLTDARAFSIHLLLVPGFAIVGALIAARRGNRVGWLFLGVGMSAAITSLGFEYSVRAYVIAPSSLPANLWLVWLQDTLIPVSFVGLAVLVLVFPDGRLPSPRWRPVAWTLMTLAAAVMLWGALNPAPLYLAGSNIPKPASIEGLGDPIVNRLGGPLAGLTYTMQIVTLLAIAFAPFVRFRRAGRRERQQLKWLALATGASAVSIFVANLLPSGRPAHAALIAVGGAGIALGIPLAVGVAILRHRLFDIDRIINRTLVYGLLSALLGLGYGGVVLVLGPALGQGRSNLAVAGATLALAAMFQPLRRRIQRMVDRRFNRRSYDAGRAVEAFSTRLRDQVDLDTLAAELLAVVGRTVEPTQASLWLRPPQRG
jgi:hypothetical protein